jgi:hypothetical protein
VMAPFNEREVSTRIGDLREIHFATVL